MKPALTSPLLGRFPLLVFVPSARHSYLHSSCSTSLGASPVVQSKKLDSVRAFQSPPVSAAESLAHCDEGPQRHHPAASGQQPQPQASNKHQASSIKHQASSFKHQHASTRINKHQADRRKPDQTSCACARARALVDQTGCTLINHARRPKSLVVRSSFSP